MADKDYLFPIVLAVAGFLIIAVGLFLLSVDKWISISIGLVFIIGVVAFSSAFKPLRADYEIGINAVASLITTLVGVYLAVSIANSHEQAKELKRKIDILNGLKRDLAYGEAQVKYRYDFTKAQVGNNEEAFQNYQKAFPNNPIGTPTLLGSFLAQDFALSTFHPDLLLMLLAANGDMLKDVARLNEASHASVANFDLMVKSAHTRITYLSKLIDIQLDYLNKKITEDEVSERRRELSYKHFREFSNSPGLKRVIIQVPPNPDGTCGCGSGKMFPDCHGKWKAEGH